MLKWSKARLELLILLNEMHAKHILEKKKEKCYFSLVFPIEMNRLYKIIVQLS